MVKCNTCDSEMETLFTSSYCPICDSSGGAVKGPMPSIVEEPYAFTGPSGYMPMNPVVREIDGQPYQVPNCHCGEEPGLDIVSKIIITPGKPNREEQVCFHLYCEHCRMNKECGFLSYPKKAVEAWIESLQ